MSLRTPYQSVIMLGLLALLPRSTMASPDMLDQAEAEDERTSLAQTAAALPENLLSDLEASADPTLPKPHRPGLSRPPQRELKRDAPASNKPSPVPSSKSQSQSQSPSQPIHISSHRTAKPLPAAAAHQALQQGDSRAAREIYEAQLAKDARNTDALAALALLHLRQGNPATARALLDQALALAPADAFAQSLLATMSAVADPPAMESRLRQLLADQPQADALHFALGNLYAAQKRWREAQDAYFRASITDRDHPDYLFNLAVSLEHLNQPQAARQHYNAAVAAAHRRPAAFDRAVAMSRIDLLEQRAP